MRCKHDFIRLLATFVSLWFSYCLSAAPFDPAAPGEIPGTDPSQPFSTPAEAARKKQSIRVNAYFAKIPEYKSPMEDLELIYDRGLLDGLPLAERREFQLMQTSRGDYEKQLKEVEKRRKAIKPLNEDWLFAALDYHTEIRSRDMSDYGYFSWDGAESDQRLKDLQDQVFLQYTRQLAGMIELYMAERKLRNFAKNYYKQVSQPPTALKPWYTSAYETAEAGVHDVLNTDTSRRKAASKEPPKPSPFDGLTPDQQRAFVDPLWDRLEKLRDLRVKTFHKLSKNTIALEKSVAEYLKINQANANVSNPKEAIKFEDASRVDEANAQIERSILQQQYLWLMEEFATQATIQKLLLQAHERKLRNKLLFPLLAEQQKANIHIGPNHALPDYPGVKDARRRVATTRARIGLLNAMQDEAKLEASSIGNASAVHYLTDTLGGEAGKWAQGVQSLAAWSRDNRETNAVRTQIDAHTGLAAFVGISYQFASNSFNALLATPLKDMFIKGARSTGWIEGWKTTTEDNYEKYNEAAGQFTPRIRYLESLVDGMSESRALQILRQMQSGPTGILEDLMTEHAWVAATQGGFAYILEPLMESRADHSALWFHNARYAYKGSINAARDRIAAARGIEIENPMADLNIADLRLGPGAVLNEYSDVLFEIPAIWKNTVGLFGGDFEDQVTYMENMLKYETQMEILLRGLESTGAGYNVNYAIEALKRVDPSSYETYWNLVKNCVEWNQAHYNVEHRQWQNTKRFNSVLRERFAGSPTSLQEITLSEFQRQEEARFSKMSVDQAFLKLSHMMNTADFAAAVMQCLNLEVLENSRRHTAGRTDLIDLSQVTRELRLKAVANQAVVAWEGLLNQAITTVLTTKITTYMNERLLSRFDERWLQRYKANIAQSAGQQLMREQLISTFMPWSQILSFQGMLNTITGTVHDLVKSRIAEEIAKQVNAYYNDPDFLDTKDLESVVGHLYDLGKDMTEQLEPIMMKRSIDWYSGKLAYDIALEKAKKAREEMRDMALGKSEDAIKQLFDEEFDKLPPETQTRMIYDASQGEAGVELGEAFADYRAAMIELDAIHSDNRARLEYLETIFGYGMLVSKHFETAMDSLTFSKQDTARRRFAADEVARSQLRTRLLFGAHTIEDLEAMVDPSNPGNLNMPNLLLRRGDNIEYLRRALKTTINEAKARQDSATVDRAMNVARAIDDIRINKINTLLAKFMDEKGVGDKVVMVIQGGAAKGNPEYQGIFGDIDFTLMLKDEAVGESDQIKAMLVQYFEDNGFPLATNASASSMDSEAFVQPFTRFDSSKAELDEVISDIVEKNKDPTRFFSEGGGEWFINNAAFSGKLLWPDGNKKVEWVEVDRSRGHGLAIDMARYLGFLGSPKYTSHYLADHPQDRKKYLEKALGKTKYFIRLIDAFEIGHPEGNKHYNDRKNINATEGRDASYHWQIYKDAKKIIDAQDPNDPNAVFTKNDLAQIELVTKMKLKGEYASPWEVIKEGNPKMSDEAAMAKAQETVDWMREKAPKIFAYLNQEWHATATQRARSPDPKVRSFQKAETQRKMSVVKAIMQNDGPESLVFLVPKVKDGKPLSADEQATEIANRLQASTGMESITDGVKQAARNIDPGDVTGEQRRQRVQQAAVQAESKAAQTPKETDIFQVDKQFRDWLSYMVNVGRN